MTIKNLNIESVKEITPNVIKDNRGYFLESFKNKCFENFNIKQENMSFSLKKGTLRGIHLQLGKHAQAKLVSCPKGRVMDVFVDLRKGSKTFGKWGSVILDDILHNQVFIPKGFGHGFLTLTDNCILSYKVDEYYDKDSEYSIIWNDRYLKIDWNIKNPIINRKDMLGSSFDEYQKKMTFTK